MKSKTSSAVAFGRVLQAVRNRSSKNQAEVAGSFHPKLSIAAVSMAESGNRPPKTEATVRGFAAALDIDDDDLIELWWAMQGMVEVEDRADERGVQQWWRQLWVSPQAELDWARADGDAKSVCNPNEETYAPPVESFALSEAIGEILRRLLGDTWEVGYKAEIGLRDPFDGRLAAVIIELREVVSEEGDSTEVPKRKVTFACPEPVARPISPDATVRPKAETISPDVAWILSSVEAMPARERAAVAGFIHGMRAGASLLSPAALAPEVTSDPRSPSHPW